MFEDRIGAGRSLAGRLSSYKKKDGVVVVGIIRGGVVTARAISEELGLPLGGIIVRKIGAPNQPELAIGAASQGGILVLDEELIDRLGVGRKYISEEVRNQKLEIRERCEMYDVRHKKDFFKNKTVILVDDGIATGATVEAAIKYLRTKRIKRMVLATPVSAKDSIEKLKKLVNEAVVLETPDYFQAVGQFYRNFPRVTDEEVIKILND